MENPILSASISVTDRCNLNCAHCYAVNGCEGKKLNQLSSEKIMDFTDQLSDMGCFSIQISGGEPLLLDDLPYTLNYISSKNIKIYIITNGTLITEKLLKKISKSNIKSFQISLDSLNPDNYKKIRGYDVIETVKNNIKLSSRFFDKELNIGSVLMKYNKDDFEPILAFARGLKARLVLIPLLTTGKGQMKGLDVDIGDKLSILKKLFSLDNDNTFKPVFPRAFYPHERNKDNIYGYCSFPYIAGIMPDSDVYPCEGLRNIAELKLGNLKKTKLEDMWNKSRIISKLVKIKREDLKGVCKRCVYNESCMGGCRASAFIHYGDFRMPDPLCQKAYEKNIFPKEALL